VQFVDAKLPHKAEECWAVHCSISQVLGLTEPGFSRGGWVRLQGECLSVLLAL
jgi:hypothetical protein